MENDLPMICPSLRMYDNEDLELLKPTSLLSTDQKKIESIHKKQNISYELNSVPTSSFFWDLNLNTSLFDIYRDILQNSNIRDFEKSFDDVSIHSSSVINDAKNTDTKEFKNYKKFKLSYDLALEKITNHLTLFDDLDNDDEKNNWKDQLLSLDNLKQLALAEWKVRGSKDLIEKELLKINASSDADQFLALSQDAKMTFDAAEKTDIVTNSAIHDINFIPYDFMENESGWNTLKLTKTELEALYLSAKNTNQNLPTEILSIDYDEKGVSGIEVDYTFVHLKRSWFNKQVMFSSYFQWKQAKPISDGINVSDAFRLPAFPKTMMLIKNLKIILDPTINNQDVNDPNKLIFFGPIVMKQQLFVNQSNNEKFLKVVTDKRTLQSDQLAYLTKKTTPQMLEIRNNDEEIRGLSGKPIDEQNSAISTIRINRMNMGAALSMKPVLNFIPKISAIPSKPFRPISTVSIKPIPEVIPKKPILITDTKLISGIFIPVNLPQLIKNANITFRITDNKNDAPIYRCSISIIGINGNNELNRIFNIESDQNGNISQNLPIGDYRISLRADEYAPFEIQINIPNTNPQTFDYKLLRQEIKFKSFFLIGMVCEKMPKIPFN